jgi:hypothetical protein
MLLKFLDVLKFSLDFYVVVKFCILINSVPFATVFVL